MRTLLLADDSVTVQRVIALTFADEPIRVVAVADGRQAMERMAAQKPDIVLAGTTLPQISGYDLARFVRNKAELRGVPVLLLSGAFETVDEARLVSSGASGVLEKPVEPTVVIGRVKELLGLQAATPPAATRTVTPRDAPADKQLPVAIPPRAVTSTHGTPSRWEQLRNQTGLEVDTRSVEASSTRSDDYLDTLDAAFASLDEQLSGRAPASKAHHNPSGPLGQSSGAPDPRSPGRRPSPGAAPPGNPVFEVDDDWFGRGESPARADARAGRRGVAEDLLDPQLRAPAPIVPADPIYEVDGAWFAENDKARAERQAEQQPLAVETGLHDVDLPQRAAAPAPPSGATDDFALELDVKHMAVEAVAPVKIAPMPSVPVVAHSSTAPVALAAPAASPPAAVAPAAAAAPVAPAAPANPLVADDFAALLAFEQGERDRPPMPPPPEIELVTPEVTGEMLEEIAAKVSDSLTASTFGTDLREAMTATMRQIVQEVVAETADRVVREVVSQTAERVIREVVSEASDRVLPGVVSEIVERVVPGIVSQTVEWAVPGVVSQAAERLLPEAVSQAVERLVPEAVSQAAEQAVRDAAAQAVRDAAAEATRQVARDVVLETSERLVREEIERIKSRHKREPQRCQRR